MNPSSNRHTDVRNDSLDNQTIVAVATPAGHGGIGIVRLSGPRSLEIALQCSQDKNPHHHKIEARKAYFRHFYDPKNQVIDSGILLYFEAPHSFTGENVVEIQAHGSPFVLDNIIQTCLHFGARLARPGEFSERAFLNDKMDLTQAEAIADLISANTETAARLAVQSLQGKFSEKIHELCQALVHLRTFVEAAIDFPEEEIDFLSDGRIQTQLEAIIENLNTVLSQASQGVLLGEGLSFVMVGRPNAGKSTLLNQLAGQDIAIVTDIAGTTRDLMRERILIDDLPIHLIDTAGLRDSHDPIELEGIRRAWNAAQQANGVILIADLSQDRALEEARTLKEELQKILSESTPIITIFNKIDRLGLAPQLQENEIYLSAQSGQGIPLLKKIIKDTAGYQAHEGQFLARRRHLEALHQAQSFLMEGYRQLTEFRAGELLAEELYQAHLSLQKITGEFRSDDLLGEIFSSFCIGK